MQRKVDAAQDYAEKHGLEFQYVDEKYLKERSLSLDELRLLKQVEIIQAKK